MADQDLEDSCRFMDESDGDEDVQAQHPGEGRDGDEEHTDWAQQPRSHHAGGERPVQVEEYELAEIVIHGPHDVNLVTTEQGGDGAASQGGERCPLDREAVEESEESDEEHEVTEPLLPKQPGAAASQGNSTVRERNVGEVWDGVDVQPGGVQQPRGAEASSVARGQDGTTKTHINVEALVNRREEDHRGSTEQHISGAGSRVSEAVPECREREEEHLKTNPTLQGSPGQSAVEARSQGRARGPVVQEAVEESKESDENSEDEDSLLSTDSSDRASSTDESESEGGSVTGWNESELLEAIKRQLDKLEASIPGGAIDVRVKSDTFNRNRDLGNVTDDQYQQRIEDLHKEMLIENTDTKIRHMIRIWERNHDLSIDCILGEKFMIQQLAKFHQSKSVEALLDVILAEGDSKKTEKDDKWADLFKQLGGLMLCDVFSFTDRLEKIITSQCCNPSKLVKVFVHVIKEASETTSEPRQLTRNLGSTIDGGIAAIISQKKPNAPTLLRNLKDILNDLDATFSKWKDDQEEEHADVEESEKKEEDKETENDSLKIQDLSIDCILGEQVMIKKLAKFQLWESVRALLDVILAEGGSEKKDAEWADLFEQLGGVMLCDVFICTDRLEKIITSQCCNPSKLVKVFLHVIKEASETTSKPWKFDRDELESTIDERIAAIISQMKPNAPTLLRNLKDILNDLDAIVSKWTNEQEEEHADVEESEKKEDDKQTEKDSLKAHSLSIDCLQEEDVMIKQLVKYELQRTVGALLDVILAEEISEKKDVQCTELFKKLGADMLFKVFFEKRDRLKKLIKSQYCNPLELVRVLLVTEWKTTQWDISEIDGMIAEIMSCMQMDDPLPEVEYIFSDNKDDDEAEEKDEQKQQNKANEEVIDSPRTESFNITSLQGEHNEIIIKLVEFDLTESVKALLDHLLSAKDDNKVEDGEWVDLIKQLGPNMLRKVFDKDCGQLFIKIIKSERWRKNATLTRIIFDAMQRETENAFAILSASVNKDDKHCSKTVFTELATSFNSLCSHDLFQQYTNAKWEQYGPYCILLFVMYLCMTFSLIYTLVTSVMAVNVHIYESGLDHSRLVFEVIAAISVIGCLLIELYQIKRSKWDYFTDWNNWLELLSSLLLCISIPMRFKAEHVHWYFFAFGYLLWIPQWRKQSVVFKEFYIQAEIFVQVLKHDVPWFSLLFLVINIAFAGASYLTLRGENDLHVDNQTSSFPEIFFMGVRTLAEGQPVLEYYGNEEYRAMSIAVMVIFLFAMCVILLNLLIAQISKTLDKKSETMDNSYHIRLAFTLAWMDILLPECCKKLGKTEERLKNYIAQLQPYKEKIISKTDKMDQHLAKITGDLQDVSQKFSIRVKKTAKQDRADTKARNGIATENYVHKTRRQQTFVDDRFMEKWNKKLTDKETEEQKVLDFIEKRIQEGHNPAEWMVDDQCPLCIAVEKDHRFYVLRRLLGLLDPKSPEAQKRKAEALYTALRINDRFYQAALLVNDLKTSEPQRVLDCFHHGADLYHDDYYNNPLFQDFWLLFLDDMMNRKDMSLFDKNVQGQKAKGTEPTIFTRLVDWGNTDFFKHAALQLYVEKKWKECGRKKQVICDMLVYLITLVCLTVVVVLTGQADDVNSYQTETDRARLVFEIISAALLLYTLVKEAIELVSTYRIAFVEQNKKIKKSRWWLFRKLKYFADLKMMRPVAHVWRGIRTHWKDNFNKAECTSTLLLLPVTITARVLDNNAFWYIFAFGYFVWVMVVFKYASIHRELSTYAQSLWIIITTDVVYFLVLFAVVNLAFSGFFVLILKGENSMHVHNETSTFWGTLFFGVRALTDGQNSLNYYDADRGPDGYNTSLTVATMVVFLFVVIVILANIFIAQLSRSYNDVQENAKQAATEWKIRDLVRLERCEWPYSFGPLKSKSKALGHIDQEEFTKYDNIESTATIKIKNVNRLVNKLAEVESDVVGIKAKATRCKNQWSTERHHLKTTIQKLEEENEKMKIQLNA